jgi:uncharacterized lipoprotein YddW (UPF0748 family)
LEESVNWVRVFIVLLFFLAAIPLPAFAQKEQFRAFWVTLWQPGAKTPEEIDRLIETIQASNANAIVVQVSRRGDAYYHRSFQPRTQDPALPPEFDLLEYIIQRAHSAQPRIEVHAWLTTLAMWNTMLGPAPRDPNHVFNAHGPTKPGHKNWFTKRRDGTLRAGQDYYLDPGHPDAVDYVVEMYKTLVANYDVDGIHLDRVRYPEHGARQRSTPEWGYNQASIERFNTAHGRTGLPAPIDPDWIAWRRDQVTALVRKIYLSVLAIKPQIKVSAATITWGQGPTDLVQYAQTAAYSLVLQDHVGWLREGILDMSIPMNYQRESMPNQRAWFRRWIEFEKDHQFNRHVVIGPALYLNPIFSSVTQIRAALDSSRAGNYAKGVCLFSYQYPANQNKSLSDLARALTLGNKYDAEFDPVFAEPVPTPRMPWKSNPATGHIMGTVGGKSLDGLPVVITGPEIRTIKTDGKGWFGAVDLKPGRYKVALANTPIVSEIDVTAGEVATTILD